MISFTTAISICAIGVFSGYFIGLVGIGAGVVMIPLLLYNGFTIQQAVASGLFLQLVPQTLPSLYMYYKTNHFLLWESVALAVGSLIGTCIGSYCATKGYITQKQLYIILCALLMVTAVYIYCTHVMGK